MASSWIRMRHDLIDAPEIRRLSKACGITKDDVLGKLFRTWSWFDRHSVSGVVQGEELDAIDEIVGHQGFSAALVSVGWLASNDVGIVIPNWERHNSESAKERALAAVRQERSRGRPPEGDASRSQRDNHSNGCHGGSVTREEERREELPPLPREGFDKQAWQALRKAWNAGPGKQWKPINPPAKAVERMADPDWLAMYGDAITKLRSCHFFDSPVTLNQFVGPDFVMNVLGGSYDEKKGRRGGKDFADTPPPPRAFTGDVAEAFERTRRKLTAKGIA